MTLDVNFKAFYAVAGSDSQWKHTLMSKLQKQAVGPDEIAEMFRRNLYRFVKGYLDRNSELHPPAVAAVNLALGEFLAESVRTQIPVWTGSMLNAVVFDVSKPMIADEKRKAVTTIVIGFKPDEARYERSEDSLGELRRLGIAIGMNPAKRQRVMTYPQLKSGSFNWGESAVLEAPGVATQVLASVLQENPDVFFKKKGTVERVLTFLDNERVKLATVNQNRIEAKAAQRVADRIAQGRPKRRKWTVKLVINYGSGGNMRY